MQVLIIYFISLASASVSLVTTNSVVNANRDLEKTNNFKVKITGIFSSAYLLFFIGADAVRY